ncbi:hypothetical protein JI739_00515 [Ramlibacter sp. AW1]|uniref:Uncharacterized protein n=1 Tax=Ramlibacter aurantiacus TaxID=2801330 RepID=A0A936ZJC1_9BURK|nr:hypothetical protein [Ramlibacter aurantiacus]MBL0418816.1 hypothetical protein [Ramlibacter aurantiacus]
MSSASIGPGGHAGVARAWQGPVRAGGDPGRVSASPMRLQRAPTPGPFVVSLQSAVPCEPGPLPRSPEPGHEPFTLPAIRP